MAVLTDSSVRLQILEYIKALYVAAVDSVTPGVGEINYGIQFSTVALGPLSAEDNRRKYTLGIVPAQERKTDLFPLQTGMLEVTTEFRATTNKGDEDPLIVAERVMAIVQQIMRDADNFGGLIVKVDEIGNEYDLYTYQDRAVNGAVSWMVHYRHTQNNVYTATPMV